MVIELFAGIGAQAMALKNSGVPHKIVAISEIDKNAIQSYMAIHGETVNLGDITQIESLPSFPDNPTLWTYSFPCQDISVAGLQKGFSENANTRSSLLWEVDRLVKDAVDRGCPPDYLLMENVDAILNEKNLPNFMKWVRRLSDMGYTSSYKVLNSKNFGVPQNRKRCFMMSARDGMKLSFSEGTPTTIRLKDILEENVDESFYLSPERLEKYEKHKVEQQEQGNHFGFNPLDTEKESVSNAVTTNPNRNATGNFIIEHQEDDGGIIVSGDLNLEGRFESANRVYDPEGMSPTIPTCGGGGIVPKIDVEGEEDAEIKIAGELLNKTFHQGRRVIDPDGIAPTVCARDFKEPTKIQIAGDLHLEQISKGGVRNNHSNDVLDPEGLSTCLLAASGEGGGHVPKIDLTDELENDPDTIIAGKMSDCNVEQAKRVYGPDGLSPAITAGGGTGSIAKIEVVGDLHDEHKLEMHNRVHSVDGISPTLYANGGIDPAPKIEESEGDQ